jgi:HPt (histidine-containing phosphotransfer) domain-containing protein
MIAKAMNAKVERTGEALDREHLARQTFGDQALEREVLALFADHTASALGLIKLAEGRSGRREAAHSLVGSARGVGAFRVADAAAAIESGAGDSQAGLAALEAAIDEVRRLIAGHLSE